MLLLPDRYLRAGQMTQRLFEAVLAGCLPLIPLTPSSSKELHELAPPVLHVRVAADANETIARLGRIAGRSEHVDLLATCLQRLDPFRLSRQILTLESLLANRTAQAQTVRSPSRAVLA